MSWTLTPNYGLKKIDYNTELNTWGGIGNTNLDDIDLKIVCPPVGSVIAFHKNLTGVPALAGNWLECNGQTVSDTNSPLFGETLPDLNGQARFLRGSSVSGTNQNATEVAVTLETNTTSLFFSDDGTNMGAHNNNFDAIITSTTTRGTIVKDGSDTAVQTSSGTVRSINMSVVWIIRIK